MKLIQYYDKDQERWRPLSASYSGLSAEDAKKHIAQLREWAKSDKSGMRYRIVNTTLVPR